MLKHKNMAACHTHSLPRGVSQTHPAKRTHRNRRRINAKLLCASQLAPLQITYTINRSDICIAELADVMSRCSLTTSTSSSSSSSVDDRTSPPTTTDHHHLHSSPQFQARLQRALNHSLIYIAAYAAEDSLPSHLDHAARSLPRGPSTGVPYLWRLAPGLIPPGGAQILVGFARAVSDAALVATIHDVMVLSEVRGRKIGRTLIDKLTDQVFAVYFYISITISCKLINN